MNFDDLIVRLNGLERRLSQEERREYAPAQGTWTPTFTGLTVGNGTLVATFTIIGTLLTYSVDFTFGSTSAITGDVSFTLPVTAVIMNSGIASFADTGIASFLGTLDMTATRGYARVFNTAGTYAASVSLSSTIPFAWATSDVLRASGSYSI